MARRRRTKSESAEPSPCRRYAAIDPGLTDEQLADERIRAEVIEEALAELRAEHGGSLVTPKHIFKE